MEYYSTFVNSSVEPDARWHQRLQELVNRQFINASTIQRDVEEEVAAGTLEFSTILPMCRVVSLVDAKTGQRVNDDYKKIIFRNLKHTPMLGTRYRFDNNIWITFSTDNIKTDTAAVYVRRCNNTINTQDEYGNIHREPCYIDYRVTENQLFREYSMDVPSGRIWVTCQRNVHTDSINVNNRFVFGGDVYKVRNRGRFDRRETFDDSTNNILSFYSDLDATAESDNIPLAIADYKEFNYDIDCVTSITNVVGYTGKVDVQIYLNKQKIQDELTWGSTSPKIVEVDEHTGEFKFKQIGKSQIVVRMAHRLDVQKIIDISVEEVITPEYYDVFEPDIYSVPINTRTKYTVYEYDNGIKTDTTYTIEFETDLPNSSYKFETDGNNTFYVTNYKANKTLPIKVTCINNRDNKVITKNIMLGGGI